MGRVPEIFRQEAVNGSERPPAIPIHWPWRGATGRNMTEVAKARKGQSAAVPQSEQDEAVEVWKGPPRWP